MPHKNLEERKAYVGIGMLGSDPNNIARAYHYAVAYHSRPKHEEMLKLDT